MVTRGAVAMHFTISNTARRCKHHKLTTLQQAFPGFADGFLRPHPRAIGGVIGRGTGRKVIWKNISRSATICQDLIIGFQKNRKALLSGLHNS